MDLVCSSDMYLFIYFRHVFGMYFRHVFGMYFRHVFGMYFRHVFGTYCWRQSFINILIALNKIHVYEFETCIGVYFSHLFCILYLFQTFIWPVFHT